jgi:hypothetical protein
MKKITRKKNCNRLNNYLVFIGVFYFLGGRLKYEKFLFHSYLSFLDFFNQVIHFYKFEYAYLLKKNLRFLQIFSIVVAY